MGSDADLSEQDQLKACTMYIHIAIAKHEVKFQNS